ncbi:MAG: hypothetical protein K8I30_11130, partial [Anaerolineae bacterium]|nr:hypothetical protein [Anaerolineae bacterium]
MKARPILFSGAMVRANLADIKTQTRRVVKRADEWHPDTRSAKVISLGADGVGAMPFDEFGRMLGGAVRCPYGQPGDRLWVREAIRPILGYAKDNQGRFPIIYRADQNGFDDDRVAGKPIPAINMPRWASRITLE